jgi:putative transposase
MPNHSHLLFLLPATMSLASAINTFKSNSSRFMHEQSVNFEWQSGYGAFSVSPSQLDKATAYIRSQREHHKKMTFEQEFLSLLKKAGIPTTPNTCSDEESAAPTALGHVPTVSQPSSGFPARGATKIRVCGFH